MSHDLNRPIHLSSKHPISCGVPSTVLEWALSLTSTLHGAHINVLTLCLASQGSCQESGCFVFLSRIDNACTDLLSLLSSNIFSARPLSAVIWMRSNVSHRLTYLNIWSLVDIWKAYRTYCLVGGSMSLRGGLWEFIASPRLQVALSAVWVWLEMWFLSFLLWLPAAVLFPPFQSLYPSGTIRQNKFLYKSLLVMVCYHSKKICY